MQLRLLSDNQRLTYSRPKGQLLKWIGNKQKFAEEICSYFPEQFNTYYEPFLGSGAILATLSPSAGIGSDIFKPLVEIWQKLKNDPDGLIDWYGESVDKLNESNKKEVYEEVKASYNADPNGKDFVFLSRACYGGVIRFRKADGYMSTPCGVHKPISKDSFAKRVREWYPRIKNTEFKHLDYKAIFNLAEKGDLIYCDPPYSYSQAILYGAQAFSLEDLFQEIIKAKDRGVYVALSIDGSKKSGNTICDLPIPKGLFENEILVNCGISMLKRFQMEGKTLEDEIVADRLLLTYFLE